MIHIKTFIAGLKLLLVLFSLTIYSNSHAQNSQWPPEKWRDTTIKSHGSHREYNQGLKGFMILNNGDTLHGIMTLDLNSCLFLPQRKFEAFRIYSNKIKYIKVYTSSLGQNYAELYTIDSLKPSKSFWRLIAKKGNISIYDRSRGIFSNRPDTLLENDVAANKFNEYMFMLVPGKKPIKIYDKFSWKTPTFVAKNRSRELMLKFINKRYHKDFTGKDFITDMDMINYILESENKNY